MCVWQLGETLRHKKMQYSHSKKRFTGRGKQIRIIGDRHNQHPDKGSSTVFENFLWMLLIWYGKTYFVLWPTNAQLSHKLSNPYMFRHYRVILRELVINNLKHFNCELYYQQLHFKYLCNLASHLLQDPWRWHDSVETCRSVIICEINVHLLVIVQNNKRCMVQRIEIR